MRIGFIGGGNMAGALIGGMLASGTPPGQLVVAEPSAPQRRRIAEQFAIEVVEDNRVAAADADALVLAVKPQQMQAVAAELAPVLADRRRVLVSVAAGLRTADLVRGFGGHALVRAMPNRPALIGAGITALYAGPEVDAGERAVAAGIMAACGAVVWVDEEAQMDVVTAVSGSGPAYFFLLMEALEAAGIRLGLKPDVARCLAVETARGAGRLAAEGAASAAELRESVTSRGGTTAAALAVLEAAGVRAIFERAVTAAAQRSAELADELSGPGTNPMPS